MEKNFKKAIYSEMDNKEIFVAYEGYKLIFWERSSSYLSQKELAKKYAIELSDSVNNYGKLKEDNEMLLEALKMVVNMDSWISYFGNGAIDKKLKAAIQKAESK